MVKIPAWIYQDYCSFKFCLYSNYFWLSYSIVFTLFLLAKNFNQIDLNNYFSSLSNSIVLGIFVGMGCIILSIFINYVSKFSKSNWLNFYKKIINMGYALPGL